MTTLLRRTPRQRRAHARARYEDQVLDWEDRTGQIDRAVWDEAAFADAALRPRAPEQTFSAIFKAPPDIVGPPPVPVDTEQYPVGLIIGPIQGRFTVPVNPADQAMQTYKDRV